MLIKKRISPNLIIDNCEVLSSFRIKVSIVYDEVYQANCIYGWYNQHYTAFEVDSKMPKFVSSVIEQDLLDNASKVLEYLNKKVESFKMYNNGNQPTK